MQMPLVSIGLPVYNGQTFITEAIECLLAQTFSDWELIISDNASTDTTMSICLAFAKKDSRIRVYPNERNMGFCQNHNRVFQLSRGRYFKWMADDDLFGAEFLECCIKELEKDDRVVLAFPKIAYVDAGGKPLGSQVNSDLSINGPTAALRVSQIMRLAAEGMDIISSQYGLIRRDILAKTQLWGLYNGSDQVLLVELALHGNYKQLEKELFFRRAHPRSSISSTSRLDWTARERAKFAYADDCRTVVFPKMRMLKEHLVCIRNSSISFREKTHCTASILKRFWSQWKDFAHELIDSPLEALRGR
jgi:glycosyltransferase involved in cell wall biosynthesis